MNIKAQRLSVAHKDSTLISEATFVRAAITATALSSKNPEASAAFSKLLWALGSSPSLDDVGEIADRWIETVEEASPAGEAVDPKQLLQTLMIGAEACMCPTARQPVRRH
ncbi:hypothetical protein ACD578_28325 (plasmid) [Microvirga sp. RSM25]|uniref:hypothetical protein n=1 Tax=Microvirga sp. RSM25 TaxID=3273802 RepID=UPI00384D4178